MPSKPDKYGVRCYCVVEWKTLYLHTLFNVGSGNSSLLNSVQRYLRIFPDMRTPVNRFTATTENKGATRALWANMIAQQSKKLQSPTTRRLFFVDNFYTSIALAEGEIKIIGTARLNYLYSANREAVRSAISLLKNATRSDFVLVQARGPNTESSRPITAWPRSSARKHATKKPPPTPGNAVPEKMTEI